MLQYVRLTHLDPTTPMPGTKERRFRQYSLRLLLLLVTAVALGLGWWTHRVETQRKAVEQLTNIGGTVQLEPWGPRWLQRTPLKGQFQQVVSVELPGERVHEVADSLRELRSIKKVKLLFEGVMVNAFGMREDPEFERLESKAWDVVHETLPDVMVFESEVSLINAPIDEASFVTAWSNGCVTILKRADAKEQKKEQIGD